MGAATDMQASNWKPIGKGALIGTFSLEMPSGLILHQCCLFRKEAREWVAGPSKQIKTADKVRYEPLVEFTGRDASDRFTREALAALSALGVDR